MLPKRGPDTVSTLLARRMHLVKIRMKLVKSILSIGAITAVAALILSSTTSCNTTRGFGRDVGKLGQEIEEEAAQHTRY